MSLQSKGIALLYREQSNTFHSVFILSSVQYTLHDLHIVKVCCKVTKMALNSSKLEKLNLMRKCMFLHFLTKGDKLSIYIKVFFLFSSFVW